MGIGVQGAGPFSPAPYICLISAYSEKTYAVTSALVPISSNSGVSHSMAITSFNMNFIVQAHRVLTDPA